MWPSGTETLSINGLPCSLHIFFEKQWVDANGQTTVDPAGRSTGERTVSSPPGRWRRRLAQRPPAAHQRRLHLPPPERRPGCPPAVRLRQSHPAGAGQHRDVAPQRQRAHLHRDRGGPPPPWVSSNVGSWTLPSKGCVPGVVPGFPGINKYCLHTITNRLPTPTRRSPPGTHPDPNASPPPERRRTPPGAEGRGEVSGGAPAAPIPGPAPPGRPPPDRLRTARRRRRPATSPGRAA